MTEYDQQVDIDVTWEFTVKQRTIPDYQCTLKIIQWLRKNLEDLTDDNLNKVFSKVNYGYNEQTIKGFGRKPVADVYINNVEYGNTIYDNTPSTVHSIIICYLKGNMNDTYEKACELTDYLIQEFEENTCFRECSVVKNTDVSNVELQIIPQGKTYGVISAFELEHELY